MRNFFIFLAAFALVACGGGGAGTPNPTPTPTPSNRAPVLSAEASYSVAENTTQVASLSATDADGDSLTWSLSGTDADLFSISSSGALAFDTAPNYESPSDGNTDNRYDITVTVSDGSLSDAQDIQISVTDVNETAPGDGGETIQGRVIDGYISGATAYLDLNFNGVLDDGEPTAVSGANGLFDLVLDAQQLACSAYTPVVVDVPVGAIDSDIGEVTDAYQLMLPPSGSPYSGESLVNITPLTSVIWGEVRRALASSFTELSCQTLQADTSKLATVNDAIDSAIRETVRRYSLTSDQLFADYIASNDSSAKQIAVEAVKGLQATFADTFLLKEQYPNADWAFVNYYYNTDTRFPEGWIREVQYKVDDLAVVELSLMDDALENVEQDLGYSERVFSSFDEFNFQREREYFVTGENFTDFGCSNKEELSYQPSDTEFQLVNLSSETNSESFEACAFESFADSTQGRYVFTRQFLGNGEEYGSQFIFDVTENGFSGLENFVDFVENPEVLDEDVLLAYIQSLPYAFCEIGTAGATFVNRAYSYQDGENNVIIDLNEDGSFSKRTDYPDGRSITEDFTAAQNPTRNGCIDDFDNDGIKNDVDTDDDGDGVSDEEDAFPYDDSEWLDTDRDGIGNNADEDDDGDGVADGIDGDPLDPEVGVLDSDGDGVADPDDEFPLDARNFTDSDADGVFDMFDAAPNNGLIDNAFIFNLGDVSDAGVSESLRESGSETIVFNDTLAPAKDFFAKVMRFFAAPVVAAGDGVVLSNQTNLVNWDENGQEVGDAILSSNTFFAAEAVLSPNGKYLYYVTSPDMQRALQSKLGLDDEWCQLYRVDLSAENTFECVLEASQSEIQPTSLSLVWRNDFQRQALSFRADGSAVVNTSGGPRLLTLDGELVNYDPARQPPSGFSRQVDNIVWLDDEHVAVTFSIFPEGGGGTTSYWSAFNVASGEEVDEVTFSDFRITKDGNRFIGTDGALSWDGTQFVIEQGVSNAVVDSYGNLWQKDSVYGLNLSDNARGLTMSLGEENTAGPNIYMESGTGTRIRYRDFAFSGDWVASKYSMLAKDTINSVEGVAYTLREQMYVDLPGEAGSFIKLTDPDLWYYVRSGNETGDVTINYEVTTAAGATEQRSYVLPLAIIENMASIDATVYDPTQYANGYELLQENGEGVSIEIPNPETERSSFCVYNTSTQVQRCAELADYKSVKYDYENIRNSPARYPSSYYLCPDQSCSAPPGVQNVVIAGDRVIAYFKDSTDNRYYKAEGELEAFMLDGDAALTFEEVVNGAGESEIIAAANKVKAVSQGILAGVSASFDGEVLSINFATPLSKYAELPAIMVTNSEGVAVPTDGDPVINASYDRIDVTMTGENLAYGASYEIDFDGWVFQKDSALRLSLAEPLTAPLEGANSFVVASDAQFTLNDYDPATGENSEIATGFTVSNGAMIVDLSGDAINQQNIDNALNGGDFEVPTVALTLDRTAVDSNTMSLTMTLIDGTDTTADSGERVASLSLDLNWQGNGATATFTAPVQTVEGYFVTSQGVQVDVTVENLDADIITLTTAGVNYPATMEIKLISVLSKLDGLLPSSLLRAGTYTAVVEFTGLPMQTDADETIDSMIIHFTIGS